MGVLGAIAVAVVYFLCWLAVTVVKYTVFGLYFLGMAIFDRPVVAVVFAIIAAFLLVIGGIFIHGVSSAQMQYG